jgi:radical SAM superfamily enzyme YgiQ (UPF0313 family)
MVDLLLVNPLFLEDDPVEKQLMTPYFPLGLLYLAASARDAGYTTSIFDAMFEVSDESFTTVLAREKPRIVGIGILATVRTAALRLAEMAHRQGAIVIVGGADPTGRPDSYLVHEVNGSYPVDVVVIGEGEQTLLDLLPVLLDSAPVDGRLGQIEGLAYRDENGQVQHTATRQHCTDLDSLPLPARDLLDLAKYRSAWRGRHGSFALSLIATRGCPYGCKWCQKSVFGRSFRPRSPESVAEEMRLMKEELHPDQLRIVDDVMGIDRAWVRKWHDAVLRNDAAIPFECLSRVDLMDEEMARLLREVGCFRIAFGAESGSQRVLDAMNKGTRVEQILAAAELCRRNSVETYFYIMLGYPGESWGDIHKTVDLLKETRPDRFSSTIAYPLPGTEFFEEVGHRLLDTPDWDYTAENRLLFQREYSTSFYRWVQRWLHQEWLSARLRHGDETASYPRKLAAGGRRWIARGMVEFLRLTSRGS